MPILKDAQAVSFGITDSLREQGNNISIISFISVIEYSHQHVDISIVSLGYIIVRISR